MEGVRQKCRPKHQVLVLKCYPQYQKGVQVVKPNSSELSYLLYYVSTRRSKLTKVGAFLEKRAARDVWRRKIGNVQVTLQILSALIEKVPRDLPIYARSVMTVLETVVRSQDISMVEDSIETFETFCRHQDMAALSAEQDFATQYREVVRSYAGFAESDSSTQSKLAAGPPVTVRWKTAGLRAIKGVVSSEAGLAADGGDSIRVILPVILENLYSPDDNLVGSLELKLLEVDKNESETAHRRRVSTATVETVDAVEGDASLAAQNTADVDRKAEMDMRLLALRCLEQIVVNGSSRGQIRVTTQVVLDFILRKSGNNLGQNYKDSWATSLVELIAKWCPVQVRFIILVAAMDILHDIPPAEESLDESYAIIYLIDRLLKSPVNMIGLSVIDVLLGLLRHMSFLISPSRAGKSTPDEKQNGHSAPFELSAKRAEVVSLLQDCIGNLTTHIYYGEQVVDMVRTILTRFKPSRGNEQAITSSPTQSDALGGGNGMVSSGEGGPIAFTLPSAKTAALKAIKNILLVANTKRPGVTLTAESRHQVGLYVWEGTQWLLSEPDRDVRYAYVDAFLTWLNLETSTDDLKVKERTGRPASQPVKTDLSDTTERPGKRTASMSGNQREKVILIAQSNFLRLLHLTIFDLATDHPTSVSEIMLLHLLLVSLVKHLGVNAVRFGLPMVLKLQDNMTTADGQPFPTLVNIGSLVYGYLWALSEKFDLETSKIGNGIQSEVQKRQQLGVWLETIRLPPVNLDKIVHSSSVQASGRGAQDVSLLIPFDGGEELIQRIEASYGSFITLLTHSPPSSPGSVGSPPRSITAPVLPHMSAPATTPKAYVLPPAVREQMLSPWSREACLAAAETERAEAKSLSGSRTGTLVIRNHVHQNGTSSPSAGSNVSVPQGAYVSVAGLQNGRRTSVPNSSGSQLISTSRESPVHVNELRRVLSVNEEGKARRMSPLRGRLDGSNRSVISSSSDSMISGYSLSEYEDGASVKPQSVRGGQISLDGEETRRASALSFMVDADDIPPVPPIPPTISIQGGLSDGQQRSVSVSRPSTAPGPRRPSVTNGKAGTPGTSPGRSLSRDKSRSSTGLAAVATDGVEPYAENIDSARLDVQKLLEGFLSPADAETKGSRRKARSNTGRRGVSGGLGRPPY
ncbi:protein efr3 [Aspergillus pseudonomiae]|uniref:Protein efr3 n=1 Tax=Aspergillus pseudonomiae TaxID=1506151 RepID=A0A5N7DJJ1_9EURO|nr:protein efr3 [Aspergillus pseudonomiae]KAB8259087.1 protein efr3 [Aspergillus pseudonomiae]KAE8406616.1 protein efr3 [Aspergillus pseudonomiae]